MRIAKAWSALAVMLCLPLTAEAHRSWMLPSATILSGDDPWVTVDAAVSNDLFYFEHFPLRLANIGTEPEALSGGPGGKQKGGGRRGGRPADLVITAPDGTRAEAKNGSMGRYRSTFDVHLAQKGTYKLAVLNDGLFATYKEANEVKRWRGTAEALAKEVPADATDLKITQSQNRMEIFVTSGKPSDTALKPSGSGLELVPVTHPNDLVAGEQFKFKFAIDGKPAADLKVTIIAGGIRYRDQLNEMTVTSNAEGEIAVKLQEPGMYWLNATVQDAAASIKNAVRRASYTATLEVLPQ